MIKPEVVSVNISKNKGEQKKPVNKPWEVIEGCGLKDDAHANIRKDIKSDTSHRQISLLAFESIEKMQRKGYDVKPGDFAENITTRGIDLLSLKIGDKIKIGKEVILKVSQIGKICHNRCAIYYQAGNCIMPKDGVFTEVMKGGMIRKGDEIIIV